MTFAVVGFRFLLATVFALAAAAKLRNASEFERAVANYQLVPAGVSSEVAKVLPWLEAGVAVLLGFGLAVEPVAAATALLLTVFTVAVSVNLARGRRIDCGCLGGVVPRQITLATVGRNLALAAIAVYVAAGPPTDVLPTGDSVAVALSAVLAALLGLVVTAGFAVWRSAHRYQRSFVSGQVR